MSAASTSRPTTACTASAPPRPVQIAVRVPGPERSPTSWAIQPQIRCRFAIPQSPCTWNVTGRSTRGPPATTVCGSVIAGDGGSAHDPIAQDPDLLELDLDLVARSHESGRRAQEADAFWSARREHVAGFEGQAPRRVGEDLV